MIIQSEQEFIETHEVEIYKFKDRKEVALWINHAFIALVPDISWLGEEIAEQAVYHNPME